MWPANIVVFFSRKMNAYNKKIINYGDLTNEYNGYVDLIPEFRKQHHGPLTGVPYHSVSNSGPKSATSSWSGLGHQWNKPEFFLEAWINHDKPAHRQVGKLDTWKLVMEVMGGFLLICKKYTLTNIGLFTTKQFAGRSRAVAVRGLLEESPQSAAEGERWCGQPPCFTTEFQEFVVINMINWGVIWCHQ